MLNKRYFKTFGIFFLFFSTANASDYLSPRTLSLGGAGRAAPLLSDAIYLNPSYGSFIPSYAVSAGYTWFNSGRNYNASAQDSRTELFQGGLGFTRREQNAALNFGASKQAIKDLGAGIGGKFLIDDGTGKWTGDTMVSTSYLVSSTFFTSLVIDNVFQSNDSQARNLYRTFYLGTKYAPSKTIQLYFDPLYSPSYTQGKKAGFSAALELGLMADFFIRAGRFVHSPVPYLDSRGSGFGLGAGWIGPRVIIDYALHRVQSNDRLSGVVTAQSASMTIYY